MDAIDNDFLLFQKELEAFEAMLKLSPQEREVSEEVIKDKVLAFVRKKYRNKRTDAWYDVWYDFKNTHHKCEYCGRSSDTEAHDILPYRQLTEDQTHDREFLEQNFILLCHEHHHSVAHLGDPYCIEFDPKIKEICAQKKRERDKKRVGEFKPYIKKLPDHTIVEKMIPKYH